MPVIRRGEPGDLAGVAAIQAASPQAPQWNAADYLRYEFLVAVHGNRVAGFVAYRMPADGECEILNLAVAPDCRRLGIARDLCRRVLGGIQGAVYLEVRESNEAARRLYQCLGFEEIYRRANYYISPQESAIVMKFHSC